MSQFKKITIVLFCIFMVNVTAPWAEEKSFTMEDIDGLQREIVRLDKKLEILKKKVAIKKMEDELSGVDTPPPTMTSEIAPGTHYPTQDKQLSTEYQPPRPSAGREHTSKKIVLPKIKSIYGFGAEKKAILVFSDGSTTEVQEGENFLVDDQKILVSKIQISGVSVKKSSKGKLLKLSFATTSKATNNDDMMGRASDIFSSPIPQPFLDSTTNNYNE
jgi:type IV pilus biogenesis protein PilP